jgi:hypothetical protein
MTNETLQLDDERARFPGVAVTLAMRRNGAVFGGRAEAPAVDEARAVRPSLLHTRPPRRQRRLQGQEARKRRESDSPRPLLAWVAACREPCRSRYCTGVVVPAVLAVDLREIRERVAFAPLLRMWFRARLGTDRIPEGLCGCRSHCCARIVAACSPSLGGNAEPAPSSSVASGRARSSANTV